MPRRVSLIPPFALKHPLNLGIRDLGLLGQTVREDDLGATVESGLVAQAVAAIPWGHKAVILEKARGPEERLCYARAAFEHGRSRAELEQRAGQSPVDGVLSALDVPGCSASRGTSLATTSATLGIVRVAVSQTRS